MRITYLISCLACSGSALALTAQSKPMIYVYNGPQSAFDRRYQGHVEILQKALERTTDMGPFALSASTEMNESRQESELDSEQGRLTVLIRGDTSDLFQRFDPAPIPVDKGLLGYRILLIHKDMQPALDAVTNLQQLQKFTIGQLAAWRDNAILNHNGLTVVTGNSYEGLFKMLANRRFDTFSRGVEEVLDEYEAQKGDFPELAIEKNLLLHYPMARFFWFARSAAGLKLRQRVEEGLKRMTQDGSFAKIFDRSHRVQLQRLNLKNRRLIRLQNPIAVPALHAGGVSCDSILPCL